MPLLDILIPTYNRAKFLRANLSRLFRQIMGAEVGNAVHIYVQDNHSSDDTERVVREFIANAPPSIRIYYSKNSSNVGLEKNVVEVFSRAQSEYIMFLGDDDFLADGYLEKVIGLVSNEDGMGYIVPAYNEIFADGKIVSHRQHDRLDLEYSTGIKAVLGLSSYSHQLSGLVFRRDGTLEAYLAYPNCRNIYPFTSFACFNMLRGKSIFLKEFATMVWCGSNKDWSYDSSGLLTEIYKNYIPYFSGLALARVQIAHTIKQSWRIRLSYKHPLNFIKACRCIWKSNAAHWITKVFILILPVWVLPFRLKDRLTKPKQKKREICNPHILTELGIND